MENYSLDSDTLLQGGRFKIIRYIGGGGFGCTYEALHTLLDTRVAIKEFFPKDFCNRDDNTSHISVATKSKQELVAKLRKKFVEEARALYTMHHPGIVHVTDIFEENDTAYYVMDYVDGQSLHDIVKRRGALPEKEAIGYILQACDALEYVHSRNRLHLDIKPGNIMIDKAGKAILIDFGASKHYDDESGENTSTLLGVNTKGYAPIEQSTQSFTTFNPATDIYALGATLYKLLSGVTPPEALMIALGQAKLSPLSVSVSENTRTVISQAMAIKPENRYQTVKSFADVLVSNDFNNMEDDKTSIDTDNTTIDDDTTIVGNIQIPKPKVEVVHNKIKLPVPEAIDLGLSVKWASFNLGASKPEEYGNYYKWGETEPADDKGWETYKLAKGVNDKLTKYCSDSRYGYHGFTDDKNRLEPMDDAATVNLGGKWRMPTLDEIRELINKCKREWTTINDMRGICVTGPNGQSVFFPAAGYRNHIYNSLYGIGSSGNYWSATLNSSNYSYDLYFYSRSWDLGSLYRAFGRSIRPVLSEQITY